MVTVWFDFVNDPEMPSIKKSIKEVAVIPRAGEDVGIIPMSAGPPYFLLHRVATVRHYWTPEGLQEIHVLLEEV